MSNDLEKSVRPQRPGELVDNNSALPRFEAFAVRGVGPGGLDLVCETVTAEAGAAQALQIAMTNAGLRGAASQVVCWVVTSLRKPR